MADQGLLRGDSVRMTATSGFGIVKVTGRTVRPTSSVRGGARGARDAPKAADGREGQPSILVLHRAPTWRQAPGQSCPPYLTPPHGASGSLPSKALIKELC